MRVVDLTLVAVGLVLCIVPVLFGSYTAFQLGSFLIYGIVGQGIALCWGRVGFLPLGQAMFFGLGAYLGGGALISLETRPWLLYPALLAAIALPTLLAGLIGLLVFRRRGASGPFFSLITLALSMLAYQIVLSAGDFTGGFNGLTGIPALPGTDPWGNLYWVILASLFACTLLLLWLGRSPIGTIWTAIAQNEDRLSFLGYNVTVMKATAFGVSAALAALAGILFASQQGIVTPQAVGYVLSGELLIWTAVGGRSSLIGPVIGAVLIGYLTAELRDSFVYWEILLALVFLAVVLGAPGGLAGLLAPVVTKLDRPKLRRRDVIRPLKMRDVAPNLVFQKVEVQMGPVRILQGLDLTVTKPGLHCLIGPNGAGKTSAFNALTGRLPVASGSITLEGRNITGLPAHRVARLGIARKLQVPSIFPEMTIADHINLALWSTDLSFANGLRPSSSFWTNDVLDELRQLFPFLQDEQQIAGQLSLGHRQMLEFALSVLDNPTLVLLDEPCAGLSMGETSEMVAAIRHMRERFNMSALIVEHDFSVVEALSDHITVLHQGQQLAEGVLSEIRANAAVQAVYSGGTK